MKEKFSNKFLTKRNLLLGVTSTYLGTLAASILTPAKVKGKKIFVDKQIDKSGLNPELYKNTVFKENKFGFFNIGVFHADDLLNYYKPIIESKIDEADIVLLEYPGTKRKGDNPVEWFRYFAHYAESKDKMAKEIDFHNLITDISGLFFNGLTLATVLHYFKEGLTKSDKEIDNIGKSFGMIFGLDYFATESLSSHFGKVLSTAANQEFARYNFDFHIDGRTIFMLLSILKIIKENPGKKIVVVTGNAHAEMFEVYSNDENLLEFKLKSFLYNIIYKPKKFLAELTTSFGVR